MSDPVSDRPFLPERRFFIPEVSLINKQRFLAELAKLLTFMYEEDRQQALNAYSEMFEEAEDEQALLQALASPLRQAVEVARAYNAGKPALNDTTKKKDDEPIEDAQRFAYLDTISRIRTEALSAQPEKAEATEAPVNEDQISLFDEAAQDEPEPEIPAPAAASAEDAPAQAQTEEAADAVEPETQNESTADEPETEQEPNETSDTAQDAQDADDEGAEAEDEAEDEEPGEIADAPLADAQMLSSDEDAAAAENTDESMPERLPVLKTVRKPRVLLMILYTLLAIPLTLIGVLVLLVPALACLAVAVGCGTLAVLTILAALGSFPKLANLLVALGAALILLAFALLMLMLFIWLVGGAIGGLIHGVIALGGKCCYKEVPAE